MEQGVWQEIELLYQKFQKLSYFCDLKRPDGGIGRRAGLKHQWIHFHPGSIPGLGPVKPR